MISKKRKNSFSTFSTVSKMEKTSTISTPPPLFNSNNSSLPHANFKYRPRRKRNRWKIRKQIKIWVRKNDSWPEQLKSLNKQWRKDSKRMKLNLLLSLLLRWLARQLHSMSLWNHSKLKISMGQSRSMWKWKLWVLDYLSMLKPPQDCLQLT